MKQLGDENMVGLEEDTSQVGDDAALSERQKKKVAERKAKTEAKMKEKEDKKKEKEEEASSRGSGSKEQGIAKLVLKEGPEKMLTHVGISPSGSSMAGCHSSCSSSGASFFYPHAFSDYLHDSMLAVK